LLLFEERLLIGNRLAEFSRGADKALQGIRFHLSGFDIWFVHHDSAEQKPLLQMAVSR
jgi:hypothetical protein